MIRLIRGRLTVLFNSKCLAAKSSAVQLLHADMSPIGFPLFASEIVFPFNVHPKLTPLQQLRALPKLQRRMVQDTA
jgi:hypothetical protein